MSKIIVFSDIHIHAYPEFATYEYGYNSRLMDCIDILDQIWNYAVRNKIKDILFCGDFFHRSDSLTPEVIGLTQAAVYGFYLDELNLIMIPGQHDYWRGDITALACLPPYVTKPIGGYVLEHMGVKLDFYLNKPTLDEQLEILSPQNALGPCRDYKNIFVGHFLVKELLEKGLYNLDIPCVSFDDLPQGYDIYLLGDYHPHVYIQEKNLVSVGATHHHTFGSVKRGLGGFLVLDMDTIEFERVELHAPMFCDITPKEIREADPVNFYRVTVYSEEEKEKAVSEFKKRKINKYRIVLKREDEKVKEKDRDEYKLHMEPENLLTLYLKEKKKPIEWLKVGKGYVK